MAASKDNAGPSEVLTAAGGVTGEAWIGQILPNVEDRMPNPNRSQRRPREVFAGVCPPRPLCYRQSGRIASMHSGALLRNPSTGLLCPRPEDANISGCGQARCAPGPAARPRRAGRAVRGVAGAEPGASRLSPREPPSISVLIFSYHTRLHGVIRYAFPAVLFGGESDR